MEVEEGDEITADTHHITTPLCKILLLFLTLISPPLLSNFPLVKQPQFRRIKPPMSPMRTRILRLSKSRSRSPSPTTLISQPSLSGRGLWGLSPASSFLSSTSSSGTAENLWPSLPFQLRSRWFLSAI